MPKVTGSRGKASSKKKAPTAKKSAKSKGKSSSKKKPGFFSRVFGSSPSKSPSKSKGKTSSKSKGKAPAKKVVKKKVVVKVKKKKKKPDPVTVGDVEISVLDEEDPGYAGFVKHFMAHFDANVTHVETVLDINNQTVYDKFDKYCQKLGKKRDLLVRNNLLVKRVYHGTYVRCNLGLGDNITPCEHPKCRLCQILQKGMRLKFKGTGGWKQPDEDIEEQPRYGDALYFSEWASAAQWYSTCHPSRLGKKGRAAVIACQVAVGQSEPLWEPAPDREGPEDGFDSISGMTQDKLHPLAMQMWPITAVYSEAAVLPTQVFVYKHADAMCPECGRQVDFEKFPVERARNAFGWFCSETCLGAYSEKHDPDDASDVDDLPVTPYTQMANGSIDALRKLFAPAPWNFSVEEMPGSVKGYSARDNKMINRAWRHGMAKVLLSDGRSEVDFRRMMEIQHPWQMMRKISMVPTGAEIPSGDPSASDEAVYVWEWEEGGVWSAYPADQTAKLETAFAAQQGTYSFTVGTTNYVVDFNRMVQTNQTTQYERGVRRVLEGAGAGVPPTLLSLFS